MAAILAETYNTGDVLQGQRELMSLPGFRFYPTEEELLDFYLKKTVHDDHQLNFDRIIPTLDLYRYDPWELPGTVLTLRFFPGFKVNMNFQRIF